MSEINKLIETIQSGEIPAIKVVEATLETLTAVISQQDERIADLVKDNENLKQRLALKIGPEQEKRCIKHLSWMIATLEFQNAQTGLNDGVESPELQDAKALRDELINENFI